MPKRAVIWYAITVWICVVLFSILTFFVFDYNNSQLQYIPFCAAIVGIILGYFNTWLVAGTNFKTAWNYVEIFLIIDFTRKLKIICIIYFKKSQLLRFMVYKFIWILHCSMHKIHNSNFFKFLYFTILTVGFFIKRMSIFLIFLI